MKRNPFHIFICASLLAATAPLPAQVVELPIDQRAQVRAYGMWWMAHQERLPLRISFERADDAFNDGRLFNARKHYIKLARYGDKYAQFRLGLISLREDRPEEAWAWFKLATEGEEYREFAHYADDVWEELTPVQQAGADRKYSSLSSEFSDFALAQKMARVFRKQLKMSTGSRLGYTDGLNLQTSSGMNTRELYERIRLGMNFSRDLIESYGNVTLREFEVIEPAEDSTTASEPPQD